MGDQGPAPARHQGRLTGNFTNIAHIANIRVDPARRLTLD